nr:hypothetical protein [Tanacetum cinerariifolium]
MKDHNDSRIVQVNSKTVENADLKDQIQEEVFANAALKNELRKLKGTYVDTKFAKPSILGKPVLQPHRNQSVVRQPTTFKSERCKFSKPQFASQVDVINNLLKPVTPHYVPKVREYVFVKPHHVIASGSFRNSSNESYRLNDIAHKYYLEVAKKKTQDKNTSLKPSVRHTTSLQNTTNGSKPKPRSNNQTSRSFPVPKSSCGMSNGVSLVAHSRNSSSFSDSKHFICSTCQKCIFNANHDDCIIKFLKNVNSHAKVQSLKTKNINKPVEPKSHSQKPNRQIFVGQRWIPTRNMFIDSITKVDSEPTNGSTEDITNPYECKQSLDVSAVSLTPYVPPSKKVYEIMFQQLFDEYFNPSPRAVSPVLTAVVAPRAIDPAGSPSLTTIDQDVPSASSSLTTQEIQSQVTHQGAEEEIHGHQNA